MWDVQVAKGRNPNRFLSITLNFFFFFASPAGELFVTQGGRELRTLTTGDVFGELAILYNCKRTATVRGQTRSPLTVSPFSASTLKSTWCSPTAVITARTAVRLWCMERQTYRTIITNKSKKKREQLMGFLKTWVNLTSAESLVRARSEKGSHCERH